MRWMEQVPVSRRSVSRIDLLLVAASSISHFRSMCYTIFMRYRLCALLFLLPLISLHASTYEIHATLDPDTHSVRGSEEITWINTAGIPAKTLQFHLYANALASNESTFAREASWRRA